jgi:SAM-dependent methyltransferase
MASGLRPKSRVIDLGAGAGAVGRALLAAEPTLHVTGVDIASVPSPDDSRLELLSGTPMEKLPFPAESFQAAVSQFGYEYGDHQATASELARVLSPNAPFSFLIHHCEGPIVAGMRRHLRAIEALCGLRVQSAFFAGNSTALADHIALLKRECPDPIFDQAERGLQAHIRQDEAARLQIWRAVAEALVPELIMLDSFDLCRADENRDIDHFVASLNKAFEVRPPRVLQTRLGQPLAWIIEGRRRA